MTTEGAFIVAIFQQREQGVPHVQITRPVVDVVGGQQNLRGVSAEGAQRPVVGLHQIALSHGSHRLQVSQVAGALTPVPGGVGPLTIAMLVRNTVTAAAGG